VPIPQFIIELREKIGHAPLWLSGVTAVIVRDDEVLLVKRSDNGAWTPVTGIMEPGEEPAVTAVREAFEEARVVVHVERLAWVHVMGPVEHVNGDQAQYLDLVFRCQYLSGDAAVGDDENSDVAWFRLEELPPISADFRRRIEIAVAHAGETRFETNESLARSATFGIG
jgi:8-oxo-dGTP pyrophosphatase MutT (NUDIX family)